MEGVLILRKTSESIKPPKEFGFHLKRNVCKFRRNDKCSPQSRTAEDYLSRLSGNGHLSPDMLLLLDPPFFALLI